MGRLSVGPSIYRRASVSPPSAALSSGAAPGCVTISIVSPALTSVSPSGTRRSPARSSATITECFGNCSCARRRWLAGEVGRDRELHELQVAAFERHERRDIADVDFLLDDLHHDFGAAHDRIDAEFLEDLLVLRIVDARDRARFMEFRLVTRQMTRLSSSSPVSAMTTSARMTPASSSTSGSQPSPTCATLALQELATDARPCARLSR